MLYETVNCSNSEEKAVLIIVIPNHIIIVKNRQLQFGGHFVPIPIILALWISQPSECLYYVSLNIQMI